jgi:hypothetical protein
MTEVSFISTETRPPDVIVMPLVLPYQLPTNGLMAEAAGGGAEH